ncbi:DUF262 domain-containing protein [Desulfonatronum thioautotrophicum]|uniref:DUF262 domain-containing protein n=1 Tax=Desulfonatronum thioautotrophicum TaxID=617001 RepID=UPI0005EB325E|nr:DUF262 domain-containing protein [Desulfonatronum thioautotrophicum]
MKLHGAAIRNFYQFCSDISKDGVDKEFSVNIPHYQRPFKWGEDKIKLLLSDSFEQGSNNDYFAGSMVTVKKGNNDPFDLIDGQQRITTVFFCNYVRFLILRSMLMHKIDIEDFLYVKDNIIELKKCYCNYVQNIDKDKACETILSKSEELNQSKCELYKIHTNESKTPTHQEIEEIKKTITENCDIVSYEFKKAFGLPNNNDDYLSTMKDFFTVDKKLRLAYSRDSLNERIKNGMSKIFIDLYQNDGPFIKIIDDSGGDKDKLELSFISAIETVFNFFSTMISEQNQNNAAGFKKAKEILEKIDIFLKNANFCVIETGKTEDAYKLFEVLNDRALELDDLDLIKNIFYKEFCDKSNISEDTDLDNYIETLDSIWGDKVFENLPEMTRQLTAYSGTTYLTGKKDILYDKKKNYRTEIKHYLEMNYSLSLEQYYTYDNIRKEFDIFRAIKLLIEKYQLPFKLRAEKALAAEVDSNKSITYKTLFFVHGLDLNGVSVGLINIILAVYFKEHPGDFVEKVFLNYLEELEKTASHNKHPYNSVHAFAEKFWKISMLAKDHNLPRLFSQAIIQDVHHKNIGHLQLDINSRYCPENQAINEFNSWIIEWRKDKKSTSDIKIKLLFLRLYKTQLNTSTHKLQMAPFNINLNDGSSLELDHLEPSTIDPSNPSQYFTTPDNIEDRTRLVNNIGNFLLLTKDLNSKKRNIPLCKLTSSTSIYEDAGLATHYLYTDLKDILNKPNNYTETLHGNIPNNNFFNERTKYMKDKFLECINLSSI